MAPLGVAAEHEALARVVHDLRSPLTVIRGLCFALQREEPRAERRRHLELIDGEVERIARGLERLLGSGAGGPAAVCLGDVAERAAERHRAPAAARGVRLATSPSPTAIGVRGDADELGRVLDNLLGNAIRHTPPGGQVRVLSRRRGDTASVTVRDDGAGVPRADRERIFAPGDRGRAPLGDGHGLGLAIARDIAERHGGRLELLPVGPGAVFRLSLPLADAGATPEAAA